MKPPTTPRLVLVLLAFGTILAAAAGMAAQTDDPFYARALERADIFYSARDFAQAARSYEIAAFGLARDRSLQARALVGLALCRAKLGNQDAAAESLRKAAGLVGWDGLAGLPLADPAKADLAALAMTIRRDAGPATRGSGPAASLLEAIKAEPRNPRLYYDLAAACLENADYAGARKALTDLMARVPAEVRARLELGRVEYLAGEYRSAGKALEAFLGLASKNRVEPVLVDLGRAYLLLSAHLRGDGRTVRTVLPGAADLFRPDKLAALPLAEPDKKRLLDIRDAYAK
jgi:tetratricopeptide (TPR) repeat protein